MFIISHESFLISYFSNERSLMDPSNPPTTKILSLENPVAVALFLTWLSLASFLQTPWEYTSTPPVLSPLMAYPAPATPAVAQKRCGSCRSAVLIAFYPSYIMQYRGFGSTSLPSISPCTPMMIIHVADIEITRSQTYIKGTVVCILLVVSYRCSPSSRLAKIMQGGGGGIRTSID